MNNPLMIALDSGNSLRFLNALSSVDQSYCWVEFEPKRDGRIVGAKYMALRIDGESTAHEMVLCGERWYIRTPVDAS